MFLGQGVILLKGQLAGSGEARLNARPDGSLARTAERKEIVILFELLLLHNIRGYSHFDLFFKGVSMFTLTRHKMSRKEESHLCHVRITHVLCTK